MCVCVFFPFILDIKFVGRTTSRGHTGGRSHGIFHPSSFCGACLNFSREKDSAITFPRRPSYKEKTAMVQKNTRKKRNNRKKINTCVPLSYEYILPSHFSAFPFSVFSMFRLSQFPVVSSDVYRPSEHPPVTYWLSSGTDHADIELLHPTVSCILRVHSTIVFISIARCSLDVWNDSRIPSRFMLPS